MTCPFCETWIGDDDHRCSRCARRVRAVPAGLVSNAYPVSMTATARVFHFPAKPETSEPPVSHPSIAPFEPETVTTPSWDPGPGQQTLFTEPVNPPRVVSFDRAMGKTESRRRADSHQTRPAPLRTGKVELRRPKSGKRKLDQDQASLDFFGPPDAPVAPAVESVICDAPVGAVRLRLKASCIDAGIILAGCFAAACAARLCGVSMPADRSTIAFLAAALFTVPLLFKILWAFSGQDSPGMQCCHLRLVDFDGNPPTRKSRYLRLAGSFISLAAAGIGLVWSFVDQDRLTWHDHISETFPTLVGEESRVEEEEPSAPLHFTATAGR